MFQSIIQSINRYICVSYPSEYSFHIVSVVGWHRQVVDLNPLRIMRLRVHGLSTGGLWTAIGQPILISITHLHTGFCCQIWEIYHHTADDVSKFSFPFSDLNILF